MPAEEFGDQIIPVQDQLAQNEEQRQQQEYMDGLDTQQQTNQHDFNRWQLDSNDLLNDLREKFGGLYWDKNIGRYVQKNKRLMNDDGIDAFFVLLQGHLNHSMALTKFNETDVARLTKEADFAVINLIMMKYKEFGIDKAYCEYIKITVDHMIYSMLLKAKDGFFIEYLKTAKKSVEQFVQRTSFPDEKRGLFGMFKR